MDAWRHFCNHYFHFTGVGMAIDVSKISMFDGVLAGIDREKIFKEMAALESGGIANPDENRMVGHYWLRNPAIAPSNDLRTAITEVGMPWIASYMRYIPAIWLDKAGNLKMFYVSVLRVLHLAHSLPVKP
jgi:glucose-6-phosphate isomerase